MARQSWKQVADKLAARLANHAFCEQHRADSPGLDCPHCEDRSAYEAYLKAGGREFRPPPYKGPVIDVHELHRADLAAMRKEAGDE